jgi:uncharacterized protein YggU (UPF0235/DUF167 family)
MPREFKITDAQKGAAFTVRVVTRADNVEIVGIQDDGSLKIRLTESPAGGRANEQLLVFLADILEVESSQIEIVAGADKPNKIISVEGVTPGWIEERLVFGYE